MRAHVPDRVILFQQQPRQFSVRWDGFPREEGEIPLLRPSVWARSTFPVPSDGTDKVKSTARRWSAGRAHGDNQGAIGWVSPEEEVENRFSNLRVVDVEVRGEGGRAWKVLQEDTRLLFDLREDVLLEAMSHGTMDQGLLKDMEFCWARIHTQMKLVRIGSAYHEACLSASARRDLQPIRDLVAGKVYRTRAGGFVLWLGAEVGRTALKGIVRLNPYSHPSRPNGVWVEKSTDTGRFCFVECFGLQPGFDANTFLEPSKPREYRSWYFKSSKSKHPGLIEDIGVTINLARWVDYYNTKRISNGNHSYGAVDDWNDKIEFLGGQVFLNSDPGGSLLGSNATNRAFWTKVTNHPEWNKTRGWNPLADTAPTP